MLWKFKDFCALIQKKNVKNWIFIEEVHHRHECYLLCEGGASVVADQERFVETHACVIHLHVAKPHQKQGQISQNFFLNQPLEEQLDKALALAQETTVDAWELDQTLKTISPIPMHDPALHNPDLMHTIIETIQKEFKQTSLFHSAECFISSIQKTIRYPSGWEVKALKTRCYLEGAFSGTHPKTGRSDEFMDTLWITELKDLSIPSFFKTISHHAQAIVQTEKPPSQSMAVLLPIHVLSELFHSAITHVSAWNAYHSLPFKKVGSTWIEKPTQDLMTITLDPSLPYEAASIEFSEQGHPQTRLTLVHDNIVLHSMTDLQMAASLQQKPSTYLGNLIVEPGTVSVDALRQYSLYLEVIQFSGLFIDPVSMTFSSEIRLAKYVHEGKTIYIKGGSLAGNFFENFTQVQFSSEVGKYTHFHGNQFLGTTYIGPQYALVQNVSIIS
jgi:predicted Zn-dependent protease